jgi:peptide/nickel transport system ATP-binding protein/oligopeptide transport system ATP-binding protein
MRFTFQKRDIINGEWGRKTDPPGVSSFVVGRSAFVNREFGRFVALPSNDPLLEVRHLKKHYALRRSWRSSGKTLAAVDDVSFHIDPGETLGLVGESGCGKTTTGRAILRLLEPTGGEVLFRTMEGRTPRTYSLLELSAGRLRALRRHLQMIFQDPYGSLNPRLTVGTALEEGLRAHGLGNRAERRRRVGQLLERVGLVPGAAGKYPHAFSGGQRQRIGIARALAVDPVFVVCDEPVSALDVAVQAQVLNLLLDLQRERGLAYLFIAHDLAVVAYMSRRIAVMYHGQIVELGASAELCQHPAHPYTRALLAAIPQGLPPADAESDPPNRTLPESTGDRPGTPPEHTGCRFQPRCPQAMPECARREPPLIQLGGGRLVRCHLWSPSP